jgi:hypothetical protein
MNDWLIDWCLAQTLAVFQLYLGNLEFVLCSSMFSSPILNLISIFNLKKNYIKFILGIKKIFIFVLCCKYIVQNVHEILQIGRHVHDNKKKSKYNEWETSFSYNVPPL